MRNIIGNMSLDEVLSGRDKINLELLKVVDQITGAYGIKILSVGIKKSSLLKNPPGHGKTDEGRAGQEDCHTPGRRRQAERHYQGRRRKIQAKILETEAKKEANIRRTEGLREAQILEAEGKTRAIESIAEAQAEAISKVNKAILDSGIYETVIALKQVEALQEMAKNPTNKIIIPTQTLDSLSIIAAITEMLNK